MQLSRQLPDTSQIQIKMGFPDIVSCPTMLYAAHAIALCYIIVYYISFIPVFCDLGELVGGKEGKQYLGPRLWKM
jgi:hypothetical protein